MHAQFFRSLLPKYLNAKHDYRGILSLAGEGRGEGTTTRTARTSSLGPSLQPNTSGAQCALLFLLQPTAYSLRRYPFLPPQPVYSGKPTVIGTGENR